MYLPFQKKIKSNLRLIQEAQWLMSLFLFDMVVDWRKMILVNSSRNYTVSLLYTHIFQVAALLLIIYMELIVCVGDGEDIFEQRKPLKYPNELLLKTTKGILGVEWFRRKEKSLRERVEKSINVEFEKNLQPKKKIQDEGWCMVR